MEQGEALDQLVVCHFCDTVSKTPQIAPGQKALCSGCGSTLFTVKKDTIDRTLAIAVAGILLFIPTAILPIIGVSAAGIYNYASLIDCIEIMIDSDYRLVAFFIFIFAIAIPMVRLLSAFYLTLSIKLNRIRPSLLIFFRSYHALDTWAMLHVYFFGVIVSMYKLVDLAELKVGGGLFSFILLLFCSTLISVTLDHHYVWDTLEQANDSANEPTS